MENATMNQTAPAKATTDMSVGDWIITMIITAIPLIGFIMLFVWAFGDSSKPSRKTFAIAALILFAAMIVLSILFSIIFGVGIMSMMGNMQ
jgi:hypothetical protein